MTIDLVDGRAASCDGQNQVEAAPLAGLADQRCLQRALSRDIVVLRPLGEGAYAWVDLVALPVRRQPCGAAAPPCGAAGPPASSSGGGKAVLKLCAGKLLLPEPSPPTQLGSGNAVAPGTGAAAAVSKAGCPLARWTAAAAAARGPVKPSPPCAFAKQKRAHAAAEGSPFVAQLLAAKQGREGHMLLLLEFAEHGSLADYLPDAEEEGLTEHEDHETKGGGGSCCGCCGGVSLQEAELGTAAAAAAWSPAAAHNCGRGPAAKRGGGVRQRPEESSSGSSGGSGSGEDEGAEGPPACVAVVRAAAARAGPKGAAGAPGGAVPSADARQTQQQQQQQEREQQRAISPPPPACGGLGEGAARFYAACLLEALSHLHARRVLHRDVKPANLLIFSCGYLKLSDLGAACVVPPGEAPTTRSGTDAFMAPECKAARPQCGAADLWSVGVTLWQMVAGRLPAWAEEEGGHDGLEFPEHFSEDLRSLLTRLLRRDPRERLCVDSARRHPFFAGLDWAALREQRLPAPPVPPRPAPRECERRLLRRRCAARCGGLRAGTGGGGGGCCAVPAGVPAVAPAAE